MSSSSSSSPPGKVRVTASGSSCTCCGFKEVDVIPSRPAFCCTDTVLRLQTDMYEAETRGDGVALTLVAYTAALKTHVREKTRAICEGVLPPVPVYRIPAHREHSPTFSFLWTYGGDMKLSSDYGLDPEVVWEYIAALFFLHRACGNMVVRPDVPAAEAAAASTQLRELHDRLKTTLLSEPATAGEN